jgi:deoxyribodipyrimidine photo-lyase
MSRSLLWFRRDLRLNDHPALNAAIENGKEVLALFIMDEDIYNRAGEFRNYYLSQSLRALDKSMGNKLAIKWGDPVSILKDLIMRYEIDEVHVTEDFAPYGVARDAVVEASGIKLIKTGSLYAVSPGRVQKPDGSNYRVYTPFYKRWAEHGWRAPAKKPTVLTFIEPDKKDRKFPDSTLSANTIKNGAQLQEAGEEAALKRWKEFKKNGLDQYDELRNYPDNEGVSRLSPHLRWGEIHPRTILADLNATSAHSVFRKEIAWREFYADVLHHYPHTSREYYSPKFAQMKYDQPGELFEKWCKGLTGFPIVDAGMRQLLREGWMHNRVRMIVASFLVKDLHLEWQHGANYFMKFLIDNDVASNSHGWQWTAGCGTDASPYYRIFNPIEQGKKFDPNGDYIRKYVPELAHVNNDEIHEPWKYLDGSSQGYPAPIVDHAAERLESLARLEEINESKPAYPFLD